MAKLKAADSNAPARNLCVLIQCCLWLPGMQTVAFAQEYPSKPVRIIVPFAAGGGSDILTRYIALQLSEVLRQSIVVDNRTGGGGIVGTELGARAEPDGYTLLETAATTLAVLPAMTKVPYDAVKDFAPVALLGSSPQLLVVHPSVPARSVKEMVALAKEKSSLLNYGSSGNGGSAHLGAELLKSAAGIQMTHIPYKGNGPALVDLVGGQIQVGITSMVSTVPYVKSGRLRALAITSTKRSKIMPDTPTIAESGYPGCEVSSWYGLLAPARTPAPIVSKLNQAIAKILVRRDVAERLAADGVDPGGDTPDSFAVYIKSEIEKWGKVIKIARIKVDE